MDTYTRFLESDGKDKTASAGADEARRNAYDEFLSDPSQGPSGAVVETALGTDPDLEARHRALSEESGYPVAAVHEQAPAIEKRLKGAALRKALRNKEYSSEWFSNVENVKIAHDDVEQLSYMENIFAGMGERVGDAGRGVENVLNVLSKGPLDPIAKALGFDSSEIPGLGTASVNAVRLLQGKRSRTAAEFQPLDYGYEERTSIDDLIKHPFVNVLPFALEQGLVSIPDMALAMVSMPTFAASMTGRVAEDRTKNDGREEVTLGDMIAAAPFAVGSAFLERAGVRGMLGVGTGNAVKKAGVAAVAKATGKAGVQEALTEGAQEGLESLGGSVGTKRGFDGGETLKSMLGGAVGGGVFGSGVRGATEASKALVKKVGEARRARSLAKATEQMNEVDSKLRARDPSKFAEFKGGLLRRNGVEEVSISADALREFQQSGGDMTWVDSLGFMEDGRFDTALVVGGDVALTPEEFSMVPAEVHTILIENIRFNGEMTLKEATEFQETGLQSELQKIVDATSGPEVEGRRDVDAIQTQVENQLLAAGRSQEEASYGGILIAQRYDTRASRIDQSALELYRADNLAIVGPDGQTQASVDDLSLALDALRSDADMQKVLRLQGNTILDEIISRGGIAPNGAFAAELDAMGITPKTVRGLFKKGGASIIDNIPASEIPFFAEQITEEGAYIPEQALLDAIEQEVTGGQNLTADQAQTLEAHSAYLDEVRDFIDQSDLTLESPEAEIRAAIEGRAFEQFERGSVQFSGGRTLIVLGPNADQTTFLHETGHVFLEQLNEDAPGSEQLDGDWKAVKSWWGKNSESLRAEAISYAKKQKDADAVATLEGMSKAAVASYVKSGDLSRGAGAEGHLSRAMHEQWARGAEDYFRTGRAPSINLQSAFNHFRAWLVSIYSAAKRRLGKDALDSQFSPEVREVMDRLLATDEEIKTIEEQYDLQALFGSAEEIGMTPSQFKEYQKAVSESVEEAKTNQLKKHLNEIERARQKWWLDEKEAMRSDVEDEVAKAPAYQAMHALALGSTPQGEALGNIPSRLNKDDVIELMGSAEALKRLPRVGGRAVYTTSKKEGGIDPEIIAGVHGYGSASEMLLDFANITPFDEATEAALEARMKDKHGDMTIPEQALEEALESTRNNKRGDVLAAELNALREGKEKVKPAFVREAAKEEIGKKKVADIRPQSFVNAERRHGKEAGKALRRGDRIGAMRSKFRQMMNFFMSHESYKARKEIDKAVKYLKKFGKRGAKFATIDADYVDQIKGILENYNLAPRLSDKKRTSLLAWAAKEANDKGVALEIPEAIQRANGTTSYKDLTLDEFRTLVDTIKNIETTGRRLKKVKVGGKTMEIQKAVDDVVKNIDENIKDKPRTLETSSKLQKKVRTAKGFAYLLINPDSTLRELDGWKDLGAAYMSIKAGIDVAIASVYIPRQMKEAVTQKEIYDRHYTKRDRLAFWKQHMVPNTSISLSKQARLSVALNSGNADNKAAMIDSGQFTEQEIEAVLDTLDERDWAFVQDTWDYIDTFWTEISESERERHGVAPTKVAGVPFETKFGTVQGGYYPLKYDKNASILAGQEQAKDTMKKLSAGHFAAKQTSKGHTKERTGSGGRAVLLDLGVVPMHVDSVIYDLALSEPINDANRILNHKDTRKIFEKKGHLVAYEQLNMWLEDVATGEMRKSDAIDVIMRHLRVGFTTSKLAWNVSTALLQPLGIIQTSAQLGKRNTARGVIKMLSHPWVGENSIFKMVEEQSDFMKTRSDTYNKDITEAHKLLTEGFLSKVLPDPVVNFFDKSFFFMMTKMQRMVDVATWLAAQQKGIADFDGDIEKANFYADRMVARAQASGIFTDRTAFERGTVSADTRQSEGYRSFTALISYFMAKNNVALERFKKTNYQNPLEILNLAVDMVLLYAVEAVLVGLIRGQFPSDDDDEALDQIGFAGKEALNTLLAGIPIVREFASEANGFSGGGVIGAVAAEGGSFIEQLFQGDVDVALVKSATRVGGTLFRFPSSQPIKTGSAIAKALDGEDVDFIEYLMGPRYNR